MTSVICKWYDTVCDSVRSILDEHGGALALTKQEWRDSLLDDNPALRHCPESVLLHIGLGLKPRGIGTRALRGNDGNVVVMFNITMFTADEACLKCEEDGLSMGAQEYFEEFAEVSA